MGALVVMVIYVPSEEKREPIRGRGPASETEQSAPVSPVFESGETIIISPTMEIMTTSTPISLTDIEFVADPERLMVVRDSLTARKDSLIEAARTKEK